MHRLLLILLGALLVFLGQHAFSDAPQILRVGQADELKFPFRKANEAIDFAELAPDVEAREVISAWDTPLSTNLVDLPDIVNVIAGGSSSDVMHLVRGGCLEPLDPVFEELGVEPDDMILPNYLDAVRFDGKMWAIPYNTEFPLLMYSKKVFADHQLDPESSSWESLLLKLERIVNGGGAGLVHDYDPDSPIARLMAETAAGHPIQDATVARADELYTRFQRRGVIRSDPEMFLDKLGVFNGQFEAGAGSVAIVDVAWAFSSESGGVLPYPARIAEGDSPAPAPRVWGWVQAFAIRKNTPEKVATAQAFIKWLLDTETQLRLVEWSRAETDPLLRDFETIYMPITKPAIESAAIQKLCEENPDYAALRQMVGALYFLKPGYTATGLDEAGVERIVETSFDEF